MYLGIIFAIKKSKFDDKICQFKMLGDCSMSCRITVWFHISYLVLWSGALVIVGRLSLLWRKSLKATMERTHYIKNWELVRAVMFLK